MSAAPTVDDFYGGPPIDATNWEKPVWVALPGTVAGLLALAFIVYLQGVIKKQKVGADIGVPKLDKLAKQVPAALFLFLASRTLHFHARLASHRQAPYFTLTVTPPGKVRLAGFPAD